MLSLTTRSFVVEKIRQNWTSALTVALISIPLSIALSIASGAGPLPGLIAGIWGTLIGSIFIGSNYNILGAAGALTTILFSATMTAPLGLGTAVLPLLAITTGVLILFIWVLKINRYLYYIPSSIMYGFAAGVAILIAVSQIFDATGLSELSRTGHLIGDLETFWEHRASIHIPSVITFITFLTGILIWKKYNTRIPAVIPAASIGILFGYLEVNFFPLEITSLYDKFGPIVSTIYLTVDWKAFITILSQPDLLQWLLSVSGVIVLIGTLETLITAKLCDKITKTKSSSSRELFGLALSNIGSGIFGGLPTTGVFIRTGANLKAGATHRTSGILTALYTALIALLILPIFSYVPMVVIAAILVNTALGLLEIDKFETFWKHERTSFGIAVLVTLVTIFHDAGLGVAIGAMVALFLFAEKVSHGRFDIVWNYNNAPIFESRGNRNLHIPKPLPSVQVVTYSIAGNFSYIDAERHSGNLKKLINHPDIPAVIIRLRALFSIDYEGLSALEEIALEAEAHGKIIIFTSVSSQIKEDLMSFPIFTKLEKAGRLTNKTREALATLGIERKLS